MTVRVVARIRSRPDTVAALRAVLEALVAPSRREPGCVAYTLLQNSKDPTDFTTVEEWRSEADEAAHMRTPHVQAALAQVPPLLAAAPEICQYRVLA